VFRNVRISYEELPTGSLEPLGSPSSFDHNAPNSSDTSNHPGRELSDPVQVFFDPHAHSFSVSNLTQDNNSTSMLLSNHTPEEGSDEKSEVVPRGPVEFDDALAYVNRVKNRFLDQPEKYRQFLEILQLYQQESKTIQDVYSEISNLFDSAPDLVARFIQFMPDTAAQTASPDADKEEGKKRKRSV
jgi:histone deacetylase complex regulatory component SIN3